MRTKVLALTALVIGFSSLSLYSQTKIAVVDTDAFSDPKIGIKSLVAAFQQVDAEFKPRRDEIAQLQTKYDQIVKDINDTKAVADPKTRQAKTDQAGLIKADIERKSSDGQKALDKRGSELTGPIYQEIGKALNDFAKQRGFDLVFDMSKMLSTVMVVNPAVDLTDAFIADYNTKNPLPAPPKP
jgi:Skp family chaperone for outer membrane proteins